MRSIQNTPLSRDIVKAMAPCPYCTARPGYACEGARGNERKSLHIERWRYARHMRAKAILTGPQP